MATEEKTTVIKCPHCGGAPKSNFVSGMIVCRWCATSYYVKGDDTYRDNSIFIAGTDISIRRGFGGSAIW